MILKDLLEELLRDAGEHGSKRVKLSVYNSETKKMTLPQDVLTAFSDNNEYLIVSVCPLGTRVPK